MYTYRRLFDCGARPFVVAKNRANAFDCIFNYLTPLKKEEIRKNPNVRALQ